MASQLLRAVKPGCAFHSPVQTRSTLLCTLVWRGAVRNPPASASSRTLQRVLHSLALAAVDVQLFPATAGARADNPAYAMLLECARGLVVECARRAAMYESVPRPTVQRDVEGLDPMILLAISGGQFAQVRRGY